jgi:hypothetical protein
VIRRFSEECPVATFATNPETPHSLTVHIDYEKINSLVMGQVILYQLSLLDEKGDPLYVSKKNYLRREIKPICKMIGLRTGAANNKAQTPQPPEGQMQKK